MQVQSYVMCSSMLSLKVMIIIVSEVVDTVNKEIRPCVKWRLIIRG